MTTLGEDVDWAAFPWPRPGDYDRKRILAALRAVVRGDQDDPATLVRCAVGNEHRGTVYPAAVAMTEQLLLVAEHHPGRPRRVALAVLEDWWGGYEPEDGLHAYVDATGTRRGVLPEIARRITAASDLLTRLTEPSAAALLTVIPLGWGHEVNDTGGVDWWGGRVDPDGSVHFPESR